MASGSVFTFGSMIVVQLASILNSVVVVRALGLFNVGIYSIVLLTISVAAIVAGFGVPAALVKFLAEVPPNRPRDVSRLLGAGVVVTLVTTSTSAVGLIILSPLLAGLYGQPEIPGLVLIAAVGLVINALFTPLIATFQAFELIRARGKRNMVTAVLSVPTTLVLVLLMGLPGSILATVANSVISVLVNASLLRAVWRDRRLSWSMPREHSVYGKILGYATPALAGALLVTPLLWFSNTYLAVQTSIGEVGRYSVGYGVASYLLFIPYAIGVPLVPIVSRLERSKPDELLPFLTMTLRVGAFLLIPPTLVLIAFPEPFLTVFFGPASTPAAPIVRIIAPAMFLAGVSSIVGSGIAGKGRMWDGLLLNIYWGVVLFGGSLVLVPTAAAIGLSFAYMAAYLAHFIGVMAYVRYKWSMKLWALTSPFLIAFISFALLTTTSWLIADPWRIPIMVAIISVATFAELTAMTRREIEVLSAPIRRLVHCIRPSQ